MKNRYSKMLVIISAFLVLILVTVASYGYFTAIVSSNSKNMVIETGHMEVTYVNGNEVGTTDNMLPGNYVEKHFSVVNTGNIDAIYDIYLNDIENTFATKSDLVYELISLNGANISESVCPSDNTKIAYNIPISVGQTHDYVLKITFKETGENQDDNKGKKFNAEVNLIETQSTDKGIYAYLFDEGDKINYEDGEFDGYTLVLSDTRKEDVEICPFNNELNIYCCNCNVVSPLEDESNPLTPKPSPDDDGSLNPLNSDIGSKNVLNNVKFLKADEFNSNNIVAYFGDISNENFYVTNYSGKIPMGSEITNNIPWIKYVDNITSVIIDGNIKPRNSSNYFYDMLFLKNLNLNNMDTSNTINMSGMFNSTGNYVENFYIDFGDHFDTSKVEDMSYMFSDTGINELDLSHFNTSNVKNMEGMFNEAFNLSSLDLSSFNTSNVESMEGMFHMTSSLVDLNISSFNTSKVKKMAAMFLGSNLVNLNLSNFNTSNVEDMSSMFADMSNLESLNISNFDTSKVVDMSSMFNLINLTSLDLSHFDTSNVERMFMMFANSKKIANLNLNGWDISNVKDMKGMFYNCEGITSLDLSHFNSSSLEDMAMMFSGMKNLTNINLSGWNTSNVTEMYSLFYGDSSLISLDLSSFDTSKVTSMYAMFYENSSLTNLNISSFNTSSSDNMSYMFYKVSALENLDVTNFNTSNVTNMESMFGYMNSLKTIDVSSFNTSKVTDMSWMFGDDQQLRTIYSLQDFDTSKVTDSSYMFANCHSLYGSKGTHPTNGDSRYARIDDKNNGRPGVFTLKTN